MSGNTSMLPQSDTPDGKVVQHLFIKRYELREAHTGRLIGRDDHVYTLLRTAAQMVEKAMVEGPDVSVEIWDCLRPNHPKVFCSFTSC